MGEAAVVTSATVKEIFVADFDITQRERLGMAVFHTLRAPFGIRIAGYVFNLVQCILHEGVEICARIDMLLAQRVTRINCEYRLHFQIFAPLQKLQQTKTVSRPITPRAAVSGALRNIADGLLPVESLSDGIAFDIIAAGKAQELWLHVCQQLHDVRACPVRAIVVGRRKKRNVLKPNRAGLGGA